MNTPTGARYTALSGALLMLAPLMVSTVAVARPGNHGQWAAANDPVAKKLIEMEREWALAACAPASAAAATYTHSVSPFIAPDFVGTSPAGPIYTKADMAPKQPPAEEPERDCKLLTARVRYFGPDLAVIYGSESAIVKGADGKEAPRTLIWTDTILRRGGKWQAIAVQDMVGK